MKRFELKKDAGDTWTLTDTVSGISLRFKEHEFNETQQVSIPESFPADPVRASRIMQAMGEYMFTYHYSIAFPVPKFEIRPDEDTGKLTVIRHTPPRFKIIFEDECDLRKAVQKVKAAAAFMQGYEHRRRALLGNDED